MWTYIGKRLLALIPTILIISLLAFIVIELPPGDFVTSYVAKMETSGRLISEEAQEALRHQYGLDRPLFVRYFVWMGKLLHGDLGISLEWNMKVGELLLPRISMSVLLTAVSMMISYAIAIPIGVYSAVKKNSIGDYFATLIGYIGVSVPSFILGLVLIYVNAKFLGTSIGGFFSREFQNAAWSFAKFKDLMAHVWVPIVIIAFSSTAGIIRTIRANLLDELKKPYVELARAKGLKESRLIMKYPFRIAINPVISGLGAMLPAMISGESILSMVLNIPTSGPIFLQALQRQDIYLAGDYILLTGILAAIGNLIADVLLAVVDPRIRYE